MLRVTIARRGCTCVATLTGIVTTGSYLIPSEAEKGPRSKERGFFLYAPYQLVDE